jgi:hypothetical protein
VLDLEIEAPPSSLRDAKRIAWLSSELSRWRTLAEQYRAAAVAALTLRAEERENEADMRLLLELSDLGG